MGFNIFIRQRGSYLAFVLVVCISLTTPGCGSSTANPAPQITALTPATALAGSADLAITLTGSGFTPESALTLEGTPLPATFISGTELTALVPSARLATAGQLTFTVNTPAPGGGTSSKGFTVFSPGVVASTNHPQVARYSFTSPVDATVTIEFGPDTNYGRRTWTLSTPPNGGQVDILVAGMLAFTSYHLRAVVELADGTLHLDTDQTFTTGGLPPDRLPSLTVTQSATLTPQPGVQLFDHVRSPPGSRAIVTDLEGNVLWYYEGAGTLSQPLRFLPDGNFLVLERNPSIMRIVDLAGDTVLALTAADLNQALIDRGMEPVAELFHHDIIQLPNGHLLLMTYHTKSFTGLVGFEGQTLDVLGDGLVELDQNLEPVWVWSSFDHLDINRHPMASPNQNGLYDWTHGNAVNYSPADGNLIVSLRHQHWVIKIDYQDGFGTGNVLWRLGAEGDFTLLNGTVADWQYAQHYPIVLDEQIGVYRLALFDNGNTRPTGDAGTECENDPAVPCFSRPVIFELDEAMQTARIVWEDPQPFFSPIIGSIQELPNGHILWDAGAIDLGHSSIVREVTGTQPPELVWKIIVNTQRTYRSFRLPSLYPGVQW